MVVSCEPQGNGVMVVDSGHTYHIAICLEVLHFDSSTTEDKTISCYVMVSFSSGVMILTGCFVMCCDP